MSDLNRYEPASVMPIMPMTPEIFANAMPVPVPQMDWNNGIIKNIFHNLKLGQIEKSTVREANISENKNRMVRANLDTIKALMTFSAETQMCFKRLEHEKDMMGIEKDKAQAELIQVQLKNMLLQGEVKLSEVELKIKMKELEEILGTQQT